jgi:hypothetical protein
MDSLKPSPKIPKPQKPQKPQKTQKPSKNLITPTKKTLTV